MKILTYNIAYLSMATAQDMAAALLSSGADVMCLNEVDKNTVRSGYKHQVREIALAMGLTAVNYRYGPSWTFQDGSQTGNALISKTPWSTTGFNKLLPFVADLQRSALFCDVGGLRICSTHLNGGDTPERDAERIQHIDYIHTQMASSPGAICGDFNHTPTRASHLHALTKWYNAGPVDSILSGPDRRDFIYLMPFTLQALVLDWPYSDHRPPVAIC